MLNFLSKTIKPLHFKGYRYLWFGMVTVGIGMMMQMTARGYLAYELTNGKLINLKCNNKTNEDPIKFVAYSNKIKPEIEKIDTP